MHSYRPLLAAATAVALALTSTAQIRVFGGPDPDRTGASVFAFGPQFSLAGGVSISYSRPEWKAEYDASFDEFLAKMKGTNQRLGKNWWTAFDTYTAVEVGGVKIEAGAYYLGLHVGDDGAFSLLVLDAAGTIKAGATPFDPTSYPEGKLAPLTLARDALEDSVARMEIAITAQRDDPTKGRFAIRWGKHELSAPVKYHLRGADKGGD